jgi:hypothetical protein
MSTFTEAPYELVKTMRCILVLARLSKVQKAKVSLPEDAQSAPAR